MKRGLLQKYVCLIFVTLMVSGCVCAFELDTSVDDEIRRTYDPSKLEKSLPALPKTSPTQSTGAKTTAPPKTLPVTPPIKTQVGVKNFDNDYKFDKSTAIRVKKGKKFKVKSSSVISDSQVEGTRVYFTSLKPVTQRYVTIPAGTSFSAVIEDSHLPQFTGNGGLIVLKVDRMTFRGQTRNIEAKITKANLKKIFFNNIKGKHQYWKGVLKQIDKGEIFYKKSRRLSSKLSDNPVGIIISPIPTIAGMAVYAVNFVGSPLFAIWSKGGRISIPAGSEFEIKLLEDVYLY